MNLLDALVITALGMAVVFIGLILTALLITSFGVVARLQERRAVRSQSIVSPVAAQQSVPSIDAPTLAVIWTVLEVERRLNRAESAGRLTIVRPVEPGRSR